YHVTALPVSQISGRVGMLKGAITDTFFIVGLLILLVLLAGLYMYKKSLQRKIASRVDVARNRAHIEEVT
ncbi:MAG: hypothetical protein U9N86_10260, partial [Bacteroidota bacterium]|nr:hypothetical protein [Bacteroidota bacterium]